MQFTETLLQGAFIVDLEERRDRRGFCARTFCVEEFIIHGLTATVAQCDLAFTHQRGTLRGLHYHVAPAAATRLLRCIQGAIHAVLVDVRPKSPTYLSYIGLELSADNRRGLYVPEMVAYGYQTLVDRTEVLCQVSESFIPGCERGLRYDDSLLGIEWPLSVTELSDQDASWPLLETIKLGV